MRLIVFVTHKCDREDESQQNLDQFGLCCSCLVFPGSDGPNAKRQHKGDRHGDGGLLGGISFTHKVCEAKGSKAPNVFQSGDGESLLDSMVATC